MPYERGVYGGEELSKGAIHSDKYRSRMKKTASMQVLKTKDRNMMSERIVEMEGNKILETHKVEKEKSNVMRLHLELDMAYVDEEDMQFLKKYGSVN